jgi:hypothetical protein
MYISCLLQPYFFGLPPKGKRILNQGAPSHFRRDAKRFAFSPCESCVDLPFAAVVRRALLRCVSVACHVLLLYATCCAVRDRNVIVT